MGINIGSFLAPYIVGTIGQTYNYHLGFSIAAVGMFVGLIQFHFQGKKYLGELGMKPTNPINENEKKQLLKNTYYWCNCCSCSLSYSVLNGTTYN